MIAAYITVLWAGRASCRDAGGAADGISSRRRRRQHTHTHTNRLGSINTDTLTHPAASAINDIKPL
jgi:hypothetical protein